MRLGLGLGLGRSGGARPFIRSVVWSQSPTGLLVLPADRSLTRASAATVQTSASTVDTSIGVDEARCGSLGLGWSGLAIEEARTNLVLRSRELLTAPWVAGTGAMTADFVAGPDGSSTGDRANCASTQYSNYSQVSLTTGNTYTFGGWFRHASSSGTTQFMRSNGTNLEAHDFSVDTTWARTSDPLAITVTASLNFIIVDGRDWSAQGGIAAGARDVVVDLVQCELGRFETEAIITAGATATRAGERYIAGNAADVADGGRVGIYKRLRPKGSIGGTQDYAAAVRIRTYDASNYVEMNATTGVVTVVIGGASYSTASGFTFNRVDDVELWVEAGGGSLNTVVKARKNGGSTTTLGTSGAPQGNVPTSGTFDDLCNGTSSQFSAWVIEEADYKNNKRPAWAA